MGSDFRPSLLRTSARQRLLAFLKERQAEGNGMPTQLEMAEAVGCARPRIREHLDKLQAEGLITRSGRARDVVVVDHDEQNRALDALRKRGWYVNPQLQELTPPGPQTELPRLDILPYLKPRATGDADERDGGGRG